jgi:hypothetical protein
MTHHLNQFPVHVEPWTHPYSPYRSEWQMLLEAGKTGAMLGTAGAAAMNLHRMQRDGITWQAALLSTAQAGVYAGIATAAATAVGRMAGHNPTLSLAASLATGTAVMYALTSPKKEPKDA